jgi:hypothetical protein
VTDAEYRHIVEPERRVERFALVKPGSRSGRFPVYLGHQPSPTATNIHSRPPAESRTTHDQGTDARGARQVNRLGHCLLYLWAPSPEWSRSRSTSYERGAFALLELFQREERPVGRGGGNHVRNEIDRLAQGRRAPCRRAHNSKSIL